MSSQPEPEMLNHQEIQLEDIENRKKEEVFKLKVGASVIDLPPSKLLKSKESSKRTYELENYTIDLSEIFTQEELLQLDGKEINIECVGDCISTDVPSDLQFKLPKYLISKLSDNKKVKFDLKSYANATYKMTVENFRKKVKLDRIEKSNLASLIDSFCEKPGESLFTFNGSQILNPESPYFAPETVENCFWKKQKEKKESVFLNTLKYYNLQMKVCTSLPARTQSEKNKTNSYCLLSALIENDKRVMEQIAQSFLKGTNGGKVDTSKAVYLLNRVGSSADSESTQQAQLDAYMRTNNWVEHLNTLEKLKNKMLIKQSVYITHLRFQLEKLVLYKESGYAKNHGVQFADVLIKIKATPQEIRIKALKILPLLPDANTFKYPTADVDLDMLINKLDEVAYNSETPTMDTSEPTSKSKISSAEKSPKDVI